jgi:aryl-alcohol dehydrogenase
MKIKAAVLREASTPFKIEDIDLAEPLDDEILVKIAAVGLCHSDIAAQHAQLPVSPPIVLGHEGAGIVEKVGSSVTKVKAGDKVVLTFPHCGCCENCKRGDVAYCEDLMALSYGGCRADKSCAHQSESGPISGNFFAQSSFASYALAYECNTVKLPDDAPLELMGPLGCGIQTGAGAVLRSINVQQGRSIAVYGGGSVGLSAVMGAVLRECSPIIVVEPVESRRALALELGATHVIDPIACDVAEKIREIVPRGTDYAVDTTGVTTVLEAAMASMANHGTMAWLGVPSDPEATLNISVLGFLSSGCTLKAVIEGDSQPEDFIPELYDYYKAGKFPLDKMVSFYPFEKINAAIDDQLSGKAIKAILTFT